MGSGLNRARQGFGAAEQGSGLFLRERLAEARSVDRLPARRGRRGFGRLGAPRGLRRGALLRAGAVVTRGSRGGLLCWPQRGEGIHSHTNIGNICVASKPRWGGLGHRTLFGLCWKRDTKEFTACGRQGRSKHCCSERSGMVRPVSIVAASAAAWHGFGLRTLNGSARASSVDAPILAGRLIHSGMDLLHSAAHNSSVKWLQLLRITCPPRPTSSALRGMQHGISAVGGAGGTTHIVRIGRVLRREAREKLIDAKARDVDRCDFDRRAEARVRHVLLQPLMRQPASAWTTRPAHLPRAQIELACCAADPGQECVVRCCAGGGEEQGTHLS